MTEYYEHLHKKSVFDNKTFCKTVKPTLLDKVYARDRVHLIEKGETVKDGLEKANIFKIFLSNIVKSLQISKNKGRLRTFYR